MFRPQAPAKSTPRTRGKHYRDYASSSKVFDATNRIILPGIIDTQVHFREPGSTDAEDLESGSRAAVLGGVTSLFEMPNTNPPTANLIEFDKKLKGELTIVISEKDKDKKVLQKLSESDKRNIGKMINKLSIKEITSLICSNKDISKKEVYNYCLKLKNEN